MERLDADIGAFNGPLQEAPKVFDTIGVNPSAHVSVGVVNDFMSIANIKAGVRTVGVSVDDGPRGNAPTDFW